VNAGYCVTLVATHFDGSLPKEEIINGIKVKRVNVGRVKILPWNLIRFWISVIKKYKKEAIFHCNDLYGLPPAWFIKTFINKKTKIVYDCHEHETEAQIYIGNPLLHFVAKIAERIMIYSADEIIVVSKSIGEDYMKMYGIEMPRLVMNCPVEQDYNKDEYFREKYNIPEDHVIFFYVGIYKQGRGIENLIDLFRKALKENSKMSLVLLTWGDDIQNLLDSIKNDKNIYRHDRLPVNEFMNYIGSADWGVLLLENISKNNDYALPNKIFDYIMVDLPIIVSNLKEMARVVTENNIGYVVNYEDGEDVVNVLKSINKGDKQKFLPNLEKAKKKYNWEAQEKVLINLYQNL
jgi:glycosyltransferase involved in cell wall biosynthesis